MDTPKEENKKLVLKPKQAIAWEYLTNSKYFDIRDIGYGGAAGGGKSYLGAAWVIHMASKYPQTKWGVGRRRIVDAQSTVMKKFIEVLGDLGFKRDVDYEYNVKNRTFKLLKSMSEIELLGLTYDPADPESEWLGGYEFTGGWIDESAEVDSRVLEIFITRLGRVRNKEMDIPIKLLQTFNPSQGHVYTTFWIPYKTKTQKHTRFIRAFVHDNFPKDHPYVKNLEQMPEGIKKDRLLRGSFEYNVSDAALIDAEAITWMLKNKVTKVGSRNKPTTYAIVDVSASGVDIDKSLIGLFNVWVDDGEFYYDCYDVLQIKHDSPEELIDYILQETNKHGIIKEHIIVDANGVGNAIARSTKLKGCISFIAHSSPIKSESGNTHTTKKKKNVLVQKMIAQYYTLRDQCAWTLASRINQHQVTASFTHEGLKDELQQECLLYENRSIGTDDKLKVTRKKEIRNKTGRSPDISDLFLMAMSIELFEKGITKARPKEERKFLRVKKKKFNFI